MKILTVLGARPQFIKAGALSREIAKYSDIQEIIIHTGQHYDKNMSDVFFEELDLPRPNHFLGIGGKSHAAMTGQMMEGIEKVALKEKPDIILVYGDTNSTLAGALVGAKAHIPVAHVEAGLRSFNMYMPEEINRVLTDRISKWLFCPTQTATYNLKKEGFPFKLLQGEFQYIGNVGDVMYDAILYYKKFARPPKGIHCLKKQDYILCTVHRAENTDNANRLKNIFYALNSISEQINVLLPLHPRTKNIIKDLNIDVSNLIIIPPVSYLEMIYLLENCKLVITDSGGLQKEAYFLEKFCITLRDETEWIELVENRVNVLAGADREKIIDFFHKHIKLIENKHIFFNRNELLKLYGDGKASIKILKELYQ